MFSKSALMIVPPHIYRAFSISFYSKSTVHGNNRNRNRKDSGTKQNASSNQHRTPYFDESTLYSDYEKDRHPTKVKYDGFTGKKKKYYWDMKDHRGHDSKHQYNGVPNRRGSKSNEISSARNKNQHYLKSIKIEKSPSKSKHRTNDASSEDEDESEIIKLKAPDWSAIEPLEINTNYFQLNDETTMKCVQAIDDYRRINDIQVEVEAPAPIIHIDELNISQRLRNIIHTEQNIGKFTRLQSQSIPIILSGKNFIGTGLMG